MFRSNSHLIMQDSSGTESGHAQKRGHGRALPGSASGAGAPLSDALGAANQLAQRARIVLRAAEGVSDSARLPSSFGLSLPTVGQWRTAFAAEGVAGLADRPRSGRPRSLDEASAPS